MAGESERRFLELGQRRRLLWDAFWMVAHDDFGKPAVAGRVGDLGLGAGLLAELLFGGCITVYPAGTRDHRVALATRQPRRPTDSIGMDLYEQIGAEPHPRPVRDWLEYLAAANTGLYSRVAESMRRAGLLEREQVQRRRGLRRRSELVDRPVEPLVANAPFESLRRWLKDPGRHLAPQEVFLLGLAESIGLATYLYHDRRAAALEAAAECQQAQPEPLRALLAHLTDAVSTAAVTRGF